MADKLEKRIDSLLSDEGLWDSPSSRETFLEAATTLTALGMPVDDVMVLLEKLYYASTAEYGG